MEPQKNYTLIPTFGNSFGTGFRVMLDNFLRLFLVTLVMVILTAPFSGSGLKFNLDDLPGDAFHWGHLFGDGFQQLFTLGALGMLGVFFGLIALAYTFLAAPVVTYGGDFIFVEAVRGKKPDFELLIKGFWTNYLYIILANLLVTALIVMGIFMLIIPGIIIGCRLVFVSYIVMDKKLDPIEAVELSWKLTRGHGWRIFAMGITSFFIFIFGLMMLIVGMFPAIMWISSSFATLYQSVLLEKEKPAEIQEAAA
ncbi:MAG: hypothetical protein JXR67_11140 [Bacteroidales bacterium]|nr:hypothetical protein [Bacteroidales bacterium]